jgi:hypothetical protein
VKFDAGDDVLYVSNVNGQPNRRDNNGYISRLAPDGTVRERRWIAGGRGGVTLDAPKGMAIVADTLWVADIDAVRGFNRVTGAPVGTISLMSMKARFLNDIDVGPDGALYVTDTGIRIDSAGKMLHPGPDRIFRIAGRNATIAIESPRLNGANGIAWDAGSGRFLVVPLMGDTVMAWRPGSKDLTPVVAGPGQYDGVVTLGNGRFLVTSWATSAIYRYDGATLTKIIDGVSSPADIEVDPAHNRVLVPLLMGNRVEFWDMGSP